MPRRCAWQLGIVRASLGVSSARASQSAVDEVVRLADVYKEVKNSAAPADLAVCRREVEPLIANLAVVWGRELHQHQHAPWAEQLLSLHSALFPDAANHGEVAYELGTVIAGLATCGCDGKKDDPDRWRAAAEAFASARASKQRVDVRWDTERLPLAEAARRGEALARGHAETIPTPPQ
jgi:hypothetical protein